MWWLRRKDLLTLQRNLSPCRIGPELYSLTKSSDWTVPKNGQPGRPVAPVPYTGGDELFSMKAKMDFEKVKGMMDAFQPLVMSISNFIWQQGRVPT